MEKSHFERKQDIIFRAEQSIRLDLDKIEKAQKEQERKIKKQQKYLKEKHHEIDITKKKIKSLAHIETQSKAQIDQNIEMLTWLIDSIDNTVAELKKNMIINSENAIIENISDFENYIQDLNDILNPLSQCGRITDKKQLDEKISQIATTLEFFSDNIDNSIDSMADLIYKATTQAVNQSSSDFDGFIEDIHQIFDTFNTVLQKLKLTNSTKKYLALEEIYLESNTILNEVFKFKHAFEDLSTQKLIKLQDLDDLLAYGLLRDQRTLRNKLIQFQKIKSDLQEKLFRKQNSLESLKDKLEFIQSEKETIRTWFEALTDEVVNNQNIATETYNVMYATLDSIHSSISFIKADLKNSSEDTIRIVINEFTRSAKAFGKIVEIIKKLDKVVDLPKKKKSITLIYQKSKSHISKIKNIIGKLSKEVRDANQAAIEKSFNEFNAFIEEFKNKFYLIEDAVSTITLSSSEQLIQDLENLSDNQLDSREEVQNLELLLTSLQDQISAFDAKIQDAENGLKIFKKDDRKRRKVMILSKSLENTSSLLIQKVHWTLKNDGIVAFDDIEVHDAISSGYECIEPTIAPMDNYQNHIIPELKQMNEDSSVSQENETSIIQMLLNSTVGIKTWTFPMVNKRETLEIAYFQKGFQKLENKNYTYKRNISTPKTYRYKNLAKPILLTIVERDGKGALILKNTSPNSTIWNINLLFKENSGLPVLPMICIIGLNPLESFVHKYTYTQANSVKPRYFSAHSNHTIAMREHRSTRLENEYRCELIFENQSDFLIHLIRLNVHDSKHLDHPIIDVKPHHMEMLRPKLDFRHNYDIQTDDDPPSIIFDYDFTLHLVYEYDRTGKYDLDALKETRGLLFKSSMLSNLSLLKSPSVSESVGVNEDVSELRLLDNEIQELREQIESLELKIKELLQRLQEKEEQRRLLTESIKKEKQITDKQKEDDILKAIELKRFEAEERRKLDAERDKIEKLKVKLQKKKVSLAKKQTQSSKIQKQEKEPQKTFKLKASTPSKSKPTAKKDSMSKSSMKKMTRSKLSVNKTDISKSSAKKTSKKKSSVKKKVQSKPSVKKTAKSKSSAKKIPKKKSSDKKKVQSKPSVKKTTKSKSSIKKTRKK